ncbi:extracellular solute-binding protein [Haloarcula pellucida]|uniref:Iron ABC transporter substrate-binding protein n=1 Tax=Haloarcula pellucida TaxID=1427151 RepID=A0A830GKM0_9EURY|nr:extracellular solute-binding protein [Halomicroarcula pellucida]MBX0347493.1 extracellular solute-binding protein [Halomicroarcula pellucida]GGN88942.1 iron ABC transporter substrate-binding protein [Halomicroarcula pellucida]
MTDSHDDASGRAVAPASRRRFLALGGASLATALTGCSGILNNGGGSSSGAVSLADFRGSGPLVEQRESPSGTSIEDLPDLEGELTLYLGGGEGGLYLDLIELLERKYENFSASHRLEPSSDLANTIIEEYEADATQADVFMAVDAGSLGAVANAGATAPLPEEALSAVPEDFQDGQGRWVGIAGRARSIPYNTDQFSASEIPSTVQQFPETAALQGTMGWAPTYSAFQSFVTAMRLLRDDDETRRWLQAMLDHGITEYNNEFVVSNTVADGTIGAGFANHYYALRVQSGRPDAPIALAFTEGDAGALVNVSGLEIVQGTDNSELAANFVRHVLSAEAQEFFATRTFAYPMIPGVAPVGDLPRIDELNPPDIDLTELADVSGTVDLMRDAGVL